MRLEVQLGESAPTIYLIENQDVYIGARDTNDIVIKSSEISGKHVKLSFKDKTCFITDMGSTNGTFLSDEQLIPGRSVEVPLEEPIMLGHQVTLRVLPKAGTVQQGDISLKSKLQATTGEAPAQEAQAKPTPMTAKSVLDMSDRTRVISLKEMKKAEEVRVKKKREKIREKKKQESKRMRAEKNALKRVSIIAGTWILLGLVGQMAWKKLIPQRPEKSYDSKNVAVDRVMLDSTLEDKEAIEISAEEVEAREVLLEFLKKPKCQTSLEEVFCAKMDLSLPASGVTTIKENLAFFVPEKLWMDEARNFILKYTGPDLKTEDRSVDDETLKRLAVVMFMHRSLGKSLPQDFKPRFFYFVFYSIEGDIAFYTAFRSEHLSSFSIKAEREWAKLNKSNGLELVQSLFSFIGYRAF